MTQPEDGKTTWALGLVALTAPALVWGDWGLALVGAASWLRLCSG